MPITKTTDYSQASDRLFGHNSSTTGNRRKPANEAFSGKRVHTEAGQSYSPTGQGAADSSAGSRKTSTLSYDVDVSTMTKAAWIHLGQAVQRDSEKQLPDKVIAQKLNNSLNKNKDNDLEFVAEDFLADSFCAALYGADSQSLSYSDVLQTLQEYTKISHKGIAAIKKLIDSGVVDQLLDKLPANASASECVNEINQYLSKKGLSHHLNPVVYQDVSVKDSFKTLLNVNIQYALYSDAKQQLIAATQAKQQAAGSASAAGQTAGTSTASSAKTKASAANESTHHSSRYNEAKTKQSNKSVPLNAYSSNAARDSIDYWNDIKNSITQDIAAGETDKAIARKLDTLLAKLDSFEGVFDTPKFKAQDFVTILDEKISGYNRLYGRSGLFSGRGGSLGKLISYSAGLHKIVDCKVRYQAEKALASIESQALGKDSIEFMNMFNKALSSHGSDYRLSLKAVFDFAGKPLSTAAIIADIKYDLKSWYKPVLSHTLVTKEQFSKQLKVHKAKEQEKQAREERRRQEQARRERTRREEQARQERRERFRQEQARSERARREEQARQEQERQERRERFRQEESRRQRHYDNRHRSDFGGDDFSGFGGWEEFFQQNRRGGYGGYNSYSDSGSHHSRNWSHSNSNSSRGSGYSSNSSDSGYSSPHHGSRKTFPESSNAELNKLLAEFYDQKMTIGLAFKVLNMQGNELDKSKLKKAYRKLSMRYHPDKFKAAEASGLSGKVKEDDKAKQKAQAVEMFKLISTANTELEKLVR